MSVDHPEQPDSVKSIQHHCRVLMVTDDRCHETDFLEAWSSFDASDRVPVNFELVFFLCLAPSSCCSPLHFWTTDGQDFFWRGYSVSARFNMVKTAALRSPWTRTSPHSSNSCGTSRTFPLIYRPRSMMQTGAWKSQSGWQSIPLFVQFDQLLCCSFSLKTSVATTRLVRLPHVRELQQQQRVSDARRGAAFFDAVSPSQRIVALWGSSATWTPSAADLRWLAPSVFFERPTKI